VYASESGGGSRDARRFGITRGGSTIRGRRLRPAPGLTMYTQFESVIHVVMEVDQQAHLART